MEKDGTGLKIPGFSFNVNKDRVAGALLLSHLFWCQIISFRWLWQCSPQIRSLNTWVISLQQWRHLVEWLFKKQIDYIGCKLFLMFCSEISALKTISTTWILTKNNVYTGTFILCDSALSKSLLRAANMELVVWEGVTLLFMTAADDAPVEDTDPVSTFVTTDWGPLCWLFCAREVTLTIRMSFSSWSPLCCSANLLPPLVSPDPDGFALYGSVDFCFAQSAGAGKPAWWDTFRIRFWRWRLLQLSCIPPARFCTCAADVVLLPASTGLTLPGRLPWNSLRNR